MIRPSTAANTPPTIATMRAIIPRRWSGRKETSLAPRRVRCRIALMTDATSSCVGVVK